MVEADGLLFTPRVSASSADRLRMRISLADAMKTGRGAPWRAEITDLTTGRRYKVRGASCGLPRCLCDAVIMEELPHAQGDPLRSVPG